MKRAVATITVYVYGETEKDLKGMANDLCRTINNESKLFEAEIESLHLKEFGKLGELKKIGGS